MKYRKGKLIQTETKTKKGELDKTEEKVRIRVLSLRSGAAWSKHLLSSIDHQSVKSANKITLQKSK